MIFADIPAVASTAAPDAIKPWLECLAWFIGLVGALLWIVHQIRGKPAEPPNQQLEAILEVMKDRIEAIDSEHESIRQKLADDKEQANRENEDRASRIHKRLDPAAENIAEIKGQMQAFTQSFDNFVKIVVALAEGKKL